MSAALLSRRINPIAADFEEFGGVWGGHLGVGKFVEGVGLAGRDGSVGVGGGGA